MRLPLNRICGGFALLVLACPFFLTLTGCGTDILTWSEDSKREGMQQYNDGRYAEAAGSFRNAIRQNPMDPVSSYWLAISYEQLQSYHEAIDAFKTSLTLMPEAGTAHYNAAMHDSAFDRLARIVAKNDATGRETDLIAQTAENSKASEDYRLLGRVFRYRGDADSALDNYRKAVKLQPDDFAAQREFGLYLEQMSQNQEAAMVLRDAYRLNQNDAKVNNALRLVGMEPGPGLLAQQEAVLCARPPVTPVYSSDETDPGLPTPAATIAGPSENMASPRD